MLGFHHQILESSRPSRVLDKLKPIWETVIKKDFCCYTEDWEKNNIKNIGFGLNNYWQIWSFFVVIEKLRCFLGNFAAIDVLY